MSYITLESYKASYVTLYRVCLPISYVKESEKKRFLNIRMDKFLQLKSQLTFVNSQTHFCSNERKLSKKKLLKNSFEGVHF